MRRVVDIVVILAIAAVAGVVVSHRSAEDASLATMADVQQSLDRLYERASYFGALDSSLKDSKTLWPVAVLPEWFDESLPSNGLLSGVTKPHRTPDGAAASRPWLDIAPPGDEGAHPPDPVAVRPDQAQFWYNPNIGVFRARVAPHLGHDDAISMYNRLNGLELAELHHDTMVTRTPLAYTPGRTPSATHASIAQGDGSAASPTITTSASAAWPQPSLFNPDPPAVYPEMLPDLAEEQPPKRRGRRRLKDR